MYAYPVAVLVLEDEVDVRKVDREVVVVAVFEDGPTEGVEEITELDELERTDVEETIVDEGDDTTELGVKVELDAAADADDETDELDDDSTELDDENIEDVATDEDCELDVRDDVESTADEDDGSELEATIEDEDSSELDVDNTTDEDDDSELDATADDESIMEEDVDNTVELCMVEHKVVHADAVPTSITSCQPPFDQKVSMEAADPVTEGVNVRVIVMLPLDAIDAPTEGNPVAVNALPTTTGFAEVEMFWYGAV